MTGGLRDQRTSSVVPCVLNARDHSSVMSHRLMSDTHTIGLMCEEHEYRNTCHISTDSFVWLMTDCADTALKIDGFYYYLAFIGGMANSSWLLAALIDASSSSHE